jgi:hypothetical protein
VFLHGQDPKRKSQVECETVTTAKTQATVIFVTLIATQSDIQGMLSEGAPRAVDAFLAHRLFLHMI